MANIADGELTEKRSMKPLLFGVIGALILGAGAFYAIYSGAALGAGDGSVKSGDSHAESSEPEHKSDVTFVALEPLNISLGKFASSRHLRFQGHLEVEPSKAAEIAHLIPRILDVLNTYLRAVSESELEEPSSMNRLRAQMLRRIQVVVGAENVHDLLITEFVLN